MKFIYPGDYFLYKEKIVKVVSISFSTIEVAYLDNDLTEIVLDSELTPIELTKELLEYNEFKFTKSDTESAWTGWWVYGNLELGVCSLDREDVWPVYYYISDYTSKVESVNQLQMLLRLCDDSKAADNFKPIIQ